MNNAKKAIDALVERVMGPRPSLASNRYASWTDIEGRLREELADATVKYGRQYPSGEMSDAWLDDQYADHTHTALLIGIKPIEKPLTKAEVIKALRSYHHLNGKQYEELADRLEAHEGELK